MSPIYPSATNSRHVRIRVAIVMPEIGLDEVPISPVMRDDTVAKKNPKIRIRIAASGLPYVGSVGIAARNTASSSDPPMTTLIGTSRSVRMSVVIRSEEHTSELQSRLHLV